MNPIQTGIAVALALGVVGAIFIFPGAWPLPAPETLTEGSSDTIITQSESMPVDTSKLEITDITVGSGATAEAGDTVTVQYVGTLTNGTVFDASANHSAEGFSFLLGAGQVIQGWDQGVVGMKEGGKRKLVIPAELAYGSQAIGDIIPANSTLVFEVEMVRVQKGN